MTAGATVIERYEPGWVSGCTQSTREVDGVRFTLYDLHCDDQVLTATIRYDFDGHSAEQRFSVRDLDDDRLAELTGAAGLSIDRWLNPVGTLVALRPTPAHRHGDRT